MGGPDVNVNWPDPTQQIQENNPMQSRSGRIGPISISDEARPTTPCPTMPCQVRYII
jgi:hypothetical protein